MNAVQEKFTRQRITHLHTWTPSLFSFRCTRMRDFVLLRGNLRVLVCVKPVALLFGAAIRWCPVLLMSFWSFSRLLSLGVSLPVS